MAKATSSDESNHVYFDFICLSIVIRYGSVWTSSIDTQTNHECAFYFCSFKVSACANDCDQTFLFSSNAGMNAHEKISDKKTTKQRASGNKTFNANKKVKFNRHLAMEIMERRQNNVRKMMSLMTLKCVFFFRFFFFSDKENNWRQIEQRSREWDRRARARKMNGST